MSFQFSVEKAGHMPTARVYFLEVLLKSGMVKTGDVGIPSYDPTRQVVIKSVALVGQNGNKDGYLTLTIEPPGVPINELIGAEITSA